MKRFLPTTFILALTIAAPANPLDPGIRPISSQLHNSLIPRTCGMTTFVLLDHECLF
jgi:hypothetical protein